MSHHREALRRARWGARVAVGAGLFVLAAPIALAVADRAGPTLDLPTRRTDLSTKDRARVRAVTRQTDDFAAAERFEAMPGGGATSTASITRDAFSHPSANLDFEERQTFFVGNGIFKKLWVAAPSSTAASDGLGPLYNARACQRCHLKDGRGHPPDGPDDVASSMFLRLSVPPRTVEEHDALAAFETLRIPEPTYGGQLQNFAVTGLSAEGQMTIDYEEIPVTLADGEVVHLRKPTYGIADLGYGPIDPAVQLSPRVANPMIGLGLLEAIHPADLMANADPDDADGDGISGKISVTRDPVTGDLTIGRFGWKASTPSVMVQSAEAFSGDIGISTPIVTDAFGECSIAQSICRDQPTGVQRRLGDVEAPDPLLGLVTFYAQNLAVPARRDVEDPKVLEGKKLFYEAGCVDCHTPKYVTSRKAEGKAQRFQLIWPYTDLLLHDMGEGLADGRPVGNASGSEWRTAPLWGIGLTETVNGHTYFLHDGRARSLLEAILWHGGEAEAAASRVRDMSRGEREALLAFLESL